MHVTICVKLRKKAMISGTIITAGVQFETASGHVACLYKQPTNYYYNNPN